MRLSGRIPLYDWVGYKVIYFVLQSIIGSHAKHHRMKYKVNYFVVKSIILRYAI